MKIADRIGNLLLPTDCCCFACEEEAHVGRDQLCDACREQLKFCSSSKCREPLDGFTAGLLYDGLGGHMARRLKYSMQTKFARTLACYIEIPPEWQFDCIVPVPLHMCKLILRGFNQSKLIAEELCLPSPRPIRTDLLRRTRFTKTQTRLDRKMRSTNVRNAFCASAKVKGLSLLLIDDVSTTQSTLLECARTLKSAGAVRVYAASACTILE